jgi:hypothetical protein
MGQGPKAPAARRMTSLSGLVVVTAICPGTIETPLARANARHWNPENPAAVLAEWGA